MVADKVKKPFYKKWWFWLLVVILIIIIASSGGDDDTGTNTTNQQTENTQTEQNNNNNATTDETKQPKKETNNVAGMGQPVKVGDVVFTANKKSTADNVGGEYGQNAQGTYLIVNVTVKNEGKEAVTTDASFFKLKVGDTEYAADSTASVYANEQADFFLQQINPGIENKGNVVFDVPADVANNPDAILQVQTGFFGTETGEISLK